MKKFRKLSSVLMAILFLFAMVTPAGSVGIDLDETIHTGGMNDLNVRQAAWDYMDTRAAYLLGETETMEWIIEGRADNEADHKAHLEQLNIALTGLSYEIILVECGGTESLVTIEESVDYAKDGTAYSATVIHELCILCDEIPFVASDAYFEEFSGFRSRSYVSPEEQEYFTNSSTAGSQLCIIAVAYSQIGQGPDENGETKYAAMFTVPTAAWCSAFICWCAVQANIRTAMNNNPTIFGNAVCQECLNHYILEGQFHKSQEYGGTYIPKPGDIMFKGSRTYNEETGEETFMTYHVGLVVSVNEAAGTFEIIHGNGPRIVVEQRTRYMSDESIIGYAHPIYENTTHTFSKYYYAGDEHVLGCINCGSIKYPLNSAPHLYYGNYDETNHWDECSGCGHQKNVTAHSCNGYLKNSTHHWYECTDCGAGYGTSLHIYLTMADGRKKCKTCGYITGGIEGGTINSTVNIDGE